MRSLALLALAPALAAAQTVGPRLSAPALPALPAAAAASAQSIGVMAAPAPAALSAPAAPAALVAAPAAAPALAAAPAAAAASGAERPAPGPKRAAAALDRDAAEFRRLVGDLTGGDAAKAAAAADGLRRLKDAHLNGEARPEKTKVLGLKPMQIPAGMIEVQEKADELRGLKAKDAEDWLKKKSVPYLEDYRGRKRPVDHHHESRAAWEAGFEKVYAHPYFDDAMHGWMKELDRERFYAATRAMGLFYDRDQFGVGPHDPNHLPEDVRGLADDPFRSLAGEVRKRGGFDKTSVPFAEFLWANFFRARLKTYPTKADFDKAVAEAMALVRDPSAKGLPGYKGR